MLPDMDDLSRRLGRLEEGLMFAEHTLDARAEDLRQVFERLAALDRRFRAIEAGLAATLDPDAPSADDAGDAPPPA